MSIFDTLAENRYQQWLADTSQPAYKAPDPKTRTRIRTSFEAQLYQQILDILESAAQIKAEEPNQEEAIQNETIKARLTQASALQFQLCVSLEKRNLPLVAATLSHSIVQRKRALGLTI
ncbi:MAG: hypothetical protein AB8B64_02615 [Granulosicoccus sp.]